MTLPIRIVIVGAGIAGLAMAGALARSRHAARLALTVLDAADRPVYDPAAEAGLRVSAIATGSARILDSIGAWQSIVSARACPYERMRVWDSAEAADGPSTLRFDADLYGVAELGHIVENLAIRSALIDVLDRLRIDLRFNTGLDSLDTDGRRYRIGLGDGESVEADLVIAADGSSSGVRERAGIAVRRHVYGQSAFVTHARPEKPHRHTAWQRFLDTGPLALLPLADGRVSIVWSTTPELAAHALEATDAELEAMLTTASDRVLGSLAPDGPRGTFSLQAQHATHYVLPGLALIGDAAHAVHPLAGQGANLGLQDVRSLCKVIDTAMGRGAFPGDRSVLRRYERERKGANTTMMHFLTGLNRLFASESRLVGGLRRGGMRLFNASGPLRDRAVSVALGVPRR